MCLENDISSVWWTSQPAVTSKSAWLTIDAHHSPDRRATLQIAVAKFAIALATIISADDYDVVLDDDDLFDF